MSTPQARHWQPPGPAIEQLADGRATGALHTETGTLYLDHGAVVHADSPHSLDLGTLLTRCGRVAPNCWRHALDRFAEHCLVGHMLVAQGSLTQGELEVCHLAALHDAAYFALGPRSLTTRFEPGVRHWLGPVNEVDPRLLRREAVRRRDRLERIWPWPQVDTAPVRRAGAAHRALAPSPRRRELLGLADGRRTPAQLARLLGRSTYATIVEVRQLAAAGLIATPTAEPVAPPPAPAASPGPSAPATPTAPAALRAPAPPPLLAAPVEAPVPAALLVPLPATRRSAGSRAPPCGTPPREPRRRAPHPPNRTSPC